MLRRDEIFKEAGAGNLQKVCAMIRGGRDLVLTWGIVSAENPMGWEFSAADNQKRTERLKKYLAEAHLKYIVLKGEDDKNAADTTPHADIFIINPGLVDMKYIAAMYGQESFIYAENDGGEMTLSCYNYKSSLKNRQKQRFRNPEYVPDAAKTDLNYEAAGQQDKVIDQKGADEFFASVASNDRKAAFQIPAFESTLQEAYDCIDKCARGKDLCDFFIELMNTTIHAEEYCGSGRWRSKGFLYFRFFNSPQSWIKNGEIGVNTVIAKQYQLSDGYWENGFVIVSAFGEANSPEKHRELTNKLCDSIQKEVQ